MAQIFLSYSHEDVEKARQLAAALETHGLSVWWDRTIPPGKTFDQVIETALSEATWVVVLWSSHSVNSNWVKSEAEDALRRGVLVPVIVEAVRLPLAFRRIEAAELQNWDGSLDNHEFRQLIRVLTSQSMASGARSASSSFHQQTTMPRQESSRSGMSIVVKLILGLLGVLIFLIVIGVMSNLDQSVSVPASIEPVPRASSFSIESHSEPEKGAITLQYQGDTLSCSLLLDIQIGSQTVTPTSNAIQVTNLSLGRTNYNVLGTINCLNVGSCNAQGAGVLNVYDGAIFNLVWQNTAYGQCQVNFVSVD